MTPYEVAALHGFILGVFTMALLWHEFRDKKPRLYKNNEAPRYCPACGTGEFVSYGPRHVVCYRCVYNIQRRKV